MPHSPQVLFIQGGGEGVHDEWDDKLFDSLQRELGEAYEVRYPRMPKEEDPSYAEWSAAIRDEVRVLDDGAAVVGHSLGGTLLINALAQESPKQGLRAIVLIAAPFVGGDGWPSHEFQLPRDLGERLPRGVTVHVFHGFEDQMVPPSHADLYARAVPQARLHRLPGRDHQLNDDLSDVAKVLSSDRG